MAQLASYEINILMKCWSGSMFVYRRNYSSRRTTDCRELKFRVPWGHISAKEWLISNCVDSNTKYHRVLGIHGWQDNSGTFDTLAPLFQDDCHFVAIDLPGHGLSSSKPEGNVYHDFDYVTDIERVSRQLGWKQFSLIGHSFGGALSLAYSAAFPNKVTKLVCVDTFNTVIVKEAAGLARRLADGIDRLLKHEENRFCGRAPYLWTRSEAVSRYMSFLKDSLSEESVEILMKRGTIESEDGLVRFTRDPRLKFLSPHGVTLEQYHSLCRGVQCEVLLVVAERGLIVQTTTHELDSVVENLLNAKRLSVVHVEGTHHVHLNNSETVALHVNRFLLS